MKRLSLPEEEGGCLAERRQPGGDGAGKASKFWSLK